MKLLPDSIKTRAILVLLIGLTISHIGSTLVYSTDHADIPPATDERMIANRLAKLAQLIDLSPAEIRQAVAEATSTPTMRVSWDVNEILPVMPDDKTTFAVIQASLRPWFGELEPGRLQVTAGAPAPLGGTHLLHGSSGEQRARVSLRLGDGSWVYFQIHYADAAGLWSSRAILSTLVMILATLIIALWATRWITAPLASFAHAAERLGMDVTAAPLSEDGPREVRAAARAFNQMQGRIRSFVEDRLRMLAAISHDLRTPITRLRLRTEQLPIDPTQQDKMLADLDEMEAMVAANLSFARDEASDEPSQDIDMAALLAALCDGAQDVGRDAEYDWTGRLIYRGRPLALKRLFSNLVDNAIRYGTRARVSAARRDHAIEIRVEDDGPGIPEDQLDAVFKPFHRLERSRNQRTGGVGLGLANARTIARAHGGDVRLTNRSGGGLIATVILPSQSPATAKAED